MISRMSILIRRVAYANKYHYPDIKTPDVLHRKPRIGMFSIGITAREHGATVEDLLGDHPDLNRAQVQAGLDYSDEHPELMVYIQTQKKISKTALRAEPCACGGVSQ
jgi:hypothetical protein